MNGEILSLATLLIGAVLGFLTRVLYDKLKEPKLVVGKVTGPWYIENPQKVDLSVDLGNRRVSSKIEKYNAYRVRIYNKEKRILNTVALNCVVWLELEGQEEPYQLCWVGQQDVVTINPGDYREADLCARNIETGEIIAPTENGYFNPRPRFISDGSRTIRGKLRVTSENSKKTEKIIIIKPTGGNELDIQFKDTKNN